MARPDERQAGREKLTGPLLDGLTEQPQPERARLAIVLHDFSADDAPVVVTDDHYEPIWIGRSDSPPGVGAHQIAVDDPIGSTVSW